MAKNRKIFMFSVVALLILSVAMAFSILDQGNNERNYTVSVIVDNSNSSRWTSLKEGLDAAAKDYGIRLNYVSTSVFWSKTQELDIVERELESGADGIILQLYASEGVHERLEQVVSRDRCVLLETDMTPEEYYQTVGPDNRKLGGVLAGELKADFGERLPGEEDRCPVWKYRSAGDQTAAGRTGRRIKKYRGSNSMDACRSGKNPEYGCGSVLLGKAGGYCDCP